MVRDIIAHRGDDHRRSSMEFLVRWTGYDASSNSWEPYKALMHVDKLHEYLHEHKMRSLIPENTCSYGESFQDFPRLFQSRLIFPLRFLVSETSHTSVYYFVYPVSPIRTCVSHEHPLELGWIQPRKRTGTVTSQHILYYCTYYSVSFTCTVHCTYYTYFTLYI